MPREHDARVFVLLEHVSRLELQRGIQQVLIGLLGVLEDGFGVTLDILVNEELLQLFQLPGYFFLL